MTTIRRAVVVALLAIWSFPAVSLASPVPASPPPVTSTTAATGGRTPTSETANLAAREKQAQDVQDFKGGEGVYIYFGSGAVLVLVIILLILII